MCENIDTGFREKKFLTWKFQGTKLLFKTFDFNSRCKNEIEDNYEKYEVDLTKQFPIK